MAGEQHFNLNSSFHPPCFANSFIYSNWLRLEQWLLTKAFGCKANVRHTLLQKLDLLSLHFPQLRLRILAAKRAELRPVGVLSAATIKGAQRSREKRNEAGRQDGLCSASRLRPWHRNITMHCPPGGRDTKCSQQIFMRGIFFIMHILYHKFRY